MLFMFTIVGAMAELERNVIRERILAGLEHARVRGTKSGAPIGRPRAIFNRAQVVELRAAGQSWRDIAASLGVSVVTAYSAYQAFDVRKPMPCATAPDDAVERVAAAG